MAKYFDAQSPMDPLAQMRRDVSKRVYTEPTAPATAEVEVEPAATPEEESPSFAPVKGGKITEGYGGYVYEYVPETEEVYILHNPKAGEGEKDRPFEVRKDNPRMAKAYGAIRAELEMRNVAPPLRLEAPPTPAAPAAPKTPEALVPPSGTKGAAPSEPEDMGDDLMQGLGAYLGRETVPTAPPKSAEAAARPGLSGAAVAAPLEEEGEEILDYGPSMEQMGAMAPDEVIAAPTPREGGAGVMGMSDEPLVGGPAPEGARVYSPEVIVGEGAPADLEAMRIGAAQRAMKKTADDLQMARLKRTIQEMPLDAMSEATFGLTDVLLGRGDEPVADAAALGGAGALTGAGAREAAKRSTRAADAAASAAEIAEMRGPDSPEVARAGKAYAESITGRSGRVPEATARQIGGELAEEAGTVGRDVEQLRRTMAAGDLDAALRMVDPEELQNITELADEMADAAKRGDVDTWASLKGALEKATARANQTIVDSLQADPKDVQKFGNLIEGALDAGRLAGEEGARATQSWRALQAAMKAAPVALPAVTALGAPLAAAGAAGEALAAPLLAAQEYKKKDRPMAMMTQMAVSQERPLISVGEDYMAFLRANPPAAKALYRKGVLSEDLMREIMGTEL